MRNINLEVTQITWPNIFNDPSTLFEYCLCMAQLLIALGSTFNNTGDDDVCVHEEAGTGVACVPACLTNATCFIGTCQPFESTHYDACGLYAKNQTSKSTNLLVIINDLDCRTISLHVIDVCSSVPSELYKQWLLGLDYKGSNLCYIW